MRKGNALSVSSETLSPRAYLIGGDASIAEHVLSEKLRSCA
jgi:hypothetical protein